MTDEKLLICMIPAIFTVSLAVVVLLVKFI